MAADPDAVREEARRALEPLSIGLIEKMKGGAKSFLQAGAEDAYCGDPAAASIDEGRRQIELLGDMIVATVREAWPELFG